MSNRIVFKFTKFTNLDNEGNEEKPNYGFRIYDSYGSHYNNLFTGIEDLQETFFTDREIDVIKVLETIQETEEFSDIDKDSCSGIEINDKFYEFSDIVG